VFEIGVVGVNSYLEGDKVSINRQELDIGRVQAKIAALNEYRSNREQDSVTTALELLKEACSEGDNVMEPMIASVRSGATIGEVNGVLRSVFGQWTSPSGV
jgi:methylmalonyl-CoA mutase N-terminal domain/subunit